MFVSELKNEAAVLQANLKQTQEDLHIEKENYKWATTRVCMSSRVQHKSYKQATARVCMSSRVQNKN